MQDTCQIASDARTVSQLATCYKTNGSVFVVRILSFPDNIGSYTDDSAAFFKEIRYEYTSFKATLKKITRSLAFDLRHSSIVIVSTHPGFVDTDRTDQNGYLIEKLNPDSTDRFYNLDTQTPLTEFSGKSKL
ncbi:Short chain dehydrogenase [Phytophthora megakarya]|uniref:Short chain dehydrogenase n=1 Tax=Phytophthora megakarya TaxID=4795 RepID=A0A225W1Q8_9STRA|nr:Short chain dehydrogenase [Phytophthora megakarya]